MARPEGSTFEAVLPYFKEQKVIAMNWGFVDGKSQTIYPWDSWRKVWFSLSLISEARKRRICSC
jgi:hypothetical protein